MSSTNTNTASPNAESTRESRDARGRFMPGNPGGPGNPFARQVALLRKALVNAVTAEDLQAIALALMAKAKQGDVAAARLLLSYTLGKPDVMPNPDRMDADEWEGYRDAAVMKEESATVVSAGDPSWHVRTVRMMRPIITDLMHQEIANVIQTPPEPKPAPKPSMPTEEERERMTRDINTFIMQRAAELAEEDRRRMQRAETPSPKGKRPETPSPKGKRPEETPSTNGHVPPPSPPSTNGRF